MFTLTSTLTLIQKQRLSSWKHDTTTLNYINKRIVIEGKQLSTQCSKSYRDNIPYLYKMQKHGNKSDVIVMKTNNSIDPFPDYNRRYIKF